ncbi:hypothetical protein GCM10008013_45890 [Paenibacillus segetis]|uniref:Uncharacterized protein n=1 Tax=Paenibacillus segetis TaxID=1325360 RepID=A0ABQ1YTA9_9BACL|nr:hypothetical protein GCM10008013_45890 [Paenibacillus segetis]
MEEINLNFINWPKKNAKKGQAKVRVLPRSPIISGDQVETCKPILAVIRENTRILSLF